MFNFLVEGKWLKADARKLINEYWSAVGDMWCSGAVSGKEDDQLMKEAIRDMLQDPNSWKD